MPTANWGIDASDVDEFDRDSQYVPYMGPEPKKGVYVWKIKVLKFVKGTKEKLPQLRAGLELVPRRGRKSERKYKSYFTMAFMPVSEKTRFRYVPFLDAIGVSGKEFTTRTKTDEEGNVKKIGKWRNTGEELIAAELRETTDENGKPKLEIGWMGAIGDLESVVDDDDDEDNEEYDNEDGEEYDDDDYGDDDVEYDDDDED